MFVDETVELAVGTTATSTANRILANNANVNRYVVGVYATNTTGAQITLNVGIGAAATLSASNAGIAFGYPIPANAASYLVGQFPARGKRANGSVGNEIMAFASATGLILTVVYREDSLSV